MYYEAAGVAGAARYPNLARSLVKTFNDKVTRPCERTLVTVKIIDDKIIKKSRKNNNNNNNKNLLGQRLEPQIWRPQTLAFGPKSTRQSAAATTMPAAQTWAR